MDLQIQARLDAQHTIQDTPNHRIKAPNLGGLIRLHYAPRSTSN